MSAASHSLAAAAAAITVAGAVAAAVATAVATASSAPSAPSDADIRKILVDRIDVQRQSVGIVIGVTDANGRRIVAHGARAAKDTRPLDGDTIFEIGSLTKVFTSLLLADAVERKEVALTDPVSKYLPETVKMPERGRAITLQDLANHTSGLPRLPANLAPKDGSNPYADYSVEQMYRFLSGYQLTRDVGAQYEYSNLGGGLLGHALARRAGMDYESLVKARITGPLGMRDTGITLTPAMKERLASGHTQALGPAANWDVPTLAGAGGLRSSANDMLKFLSAALSAAGGQTSSPLAVPMSKMFAARWPAGFSSMEVALGWHILKPSGGDIVWHNGGTGGYRSYMGYNPRTRVGIIALSNTSTPIGVDDIGQHLLDASLPLTQNQQKPAAPPNLPPKIAVAPEVLERYTGRYQLAPGMIFTITRQDARLFAQLTNQPAFEVFPSSEREFFYTVVNAKLVFEADGTGPATAVVLHQNGQTPRAIRIDEKQ